VKAEQKEYKEELPSAEKRLLNRKKERKKKKKKNHQPPRKGSIAYSAQKKRSPGLTVRQKRESPQLK